MGRRAYMNLLALGRSPYEAPEETQEDRVRPQRQLHGDGYIQQYDARGHPINPSSKALAKQLRRAKNDILSTMGIIVSGEDGALGSRKERQKFKVIADENDYGLVMATLDQVVMFVYPWWAASLGARIQTFKRYAQIPIMQIMEIERRGMGTLGFAFAGMPVWIVSFFSTVCRNHILGVALDYAHSKLASLFNSRRYKAVIGGIFKAISASARALLIVLSGQAYMFALLQSLHVLPATTIPRLSSLIPFTATSITQLPPLPVDGSFSSIAEFVFKLLTSPSILIYAYIDLRPMLEGRIYRLLRRRLPKPDRPDQLSVRVAVENDLIEWTVPAMGRRAEEENLRSQLTITEEILYELILLKNWVKGFFQWKPNRKNEEASDGDKYESVENRIERLQRIQSELARREGGTTAQSQAQGVQQPVHQPQDTQQVPAGTSSTDLNQISTNTAFFPDEEHRITQSPQQLPEDYFPRTTNSTSGALQSASGQINPTSNGFANFDEDSRQQNSRANTLFSRPSSPESSPLPSPRVRASLVHQNSDIITMQLELLQSSRSTNPPAQSNNGAGSTNAPLSSSIFQQQQPQPVQLASFDGTASGIDRATSELLDTLLSNQVLTDGQGPLNGDGGNPATEGSVPPALQTGPAPLHAEALATAAETIAGRGSISRSPHSMSLQPSQLPQPSTIGESLSDGQVIPIPTRTLPRPLSERLLPNHRVTILSAHPVDSLASHLAAIITTVLYYPLESLYLRHLASTFLSAPAVLSGAVPLGMAASTLGLRPVGAWFGGGGRWERLGYVNQMILVTGLQAFISAGIWSAGAAITMLLGKKRFGWGNL
ncbi:hypothetical protein VTO42DRAFT_3882 [Malbranchea cinnamomea]